MPTVLLTYVRTYLDPVADESKQLEVALELLLRRHNSGRAPTDGIDRGLAMVTSAPNRFPPATLLATVTRLLAGEYRANTLADVAFPKMMLSLLLVGSAEVLKVHVTCDKYVQHMAGMKCVCA